MKSEAPVRARKAVDMIRRFSLAMMATWNGNLYCGVSKVSPSSSGCARG
jgi:hypothetical protein